MASRGPATATVLYSWRRLYREYGQVEVASDVISNYVIRIRVKFGDSFESRDSLTSWRTKRAQTQRGSWRFAKKNLVA